MDRTPYITGLNEWVIDEDDPLKYGFLLGKDKKDHPMENDDHLGIRYRNKRLA